MGESLVDIASNYISLTPLADDPTIYKGQCPFCSSNPCSLHIKGENYWCTEPTCQTYGGKAGLTKRLAEMRRSLETQVYEPVGQN